MENSEVIEVEEKKNEKKVSIEDVRNAVGFLGRKVEAIVNILEKQFGIDLNKDGKIGLGIVLAVILSVSSASAASNVLEIADSGNVRLTAAFDGNANDVLSLYGYSTNYVETGRNEN